MNQSLTYSVLTDIFMDVFQDDNIVLNHETTADDIEGWDSLSNIQMILSVERAFKIRLSAAQVSSLSCLGDLVEIIDRKTEQLRA